jgi:hypothetical protein
MQLISPCRSGDSRSLLVSAMTGARVERERIAAPKSLLPLETWAAVRGIMEVEVTLRRAEARAAGDGEGVVISG